MINYLLIFLSILFILLYNNWYTIKVNLVVLFTIFRGLVASNCFWWRLNDLFHDSSGIHTYYELQKLGPFYKVNIFGTDVHIMTDINSIYEVLEKSPAVFGVGSMKLAFFKTFMEKNVGVANECPWKRSRKLNEDVLFNFKPSSTIKPIMLSLDKLPTNYNEFSELAKRMTMKIVFGIEYKDTNEHNAIFDMLSEGNSLLNIIRDKKDKVKSYKKFREFIIKRINEINNESDVYDNKKYTDSLLSMALLKNNNLDMDEFIDQVPHWVFPVNSLFSVAGPRLLLLLANHPEVLEKLINSKYDKSYFRKCILELVRLNNPVNSMFRTLLRDYSFTVNNVEYNFKKGEQVLILNNPILRDPNIFENPNKYIPERWNEELEKSYYAISFGKGPQECPGRFLVMRILIDYLTHYLTLCPKLETTKHNKLNINYIPQAINPCLIEFKCTNS